MMTLQLFFFRVSSVICSESQGFCTPSFYKTARNDKMHSKPTLRRHFPDPLLIMS